MFPLVLVVLIGSVHLTSAQSREKSLITVVIDNVQEDVSLGCHLQIKDFLADFNSSGNASWALQMVDSSSKIPSGLLNLNFDEMGDFDECVQIRVSADQLQGEEILGKYCLGYISLSNLTVANLTMISRYGSIPSTSAVPMDLIWSLCVPNRCTTNDTDVIGNAILDAVLPDLGLRVNFSDKFCQTIHEVDPELSGGAIASIIVFTVLALNILMCSCYDMYSTFFGKKNCPFIIKGFSVYTNSRKIFTMTTTTNSDQFPCLDGLKFYSMMWVVIGHQFSVPISGSITNTKYMVQWANDWNSMFIVSGTLAVDTFLTVGGTLMAYTYLSRARSRGIVSYNPLWYYLHRYLRLTAPFALVVLFSATLLKYTGSGPRWPSLIEDFQNNCEENWYLALLYVQNYFNLGKMCVGQTWYLNIDMQLYIISPLVFWGLWKYPKFTIPLLTICGLGFMSWSFYVSWDYHLAAILSNFYTTSNIDFQNKYYLLTHTRSTPWIIGVVVGYFLFKIKQKEANFKLPRWVLVPSWALCLTLLFALMLSGHSTLRGPEYDIWGNAFYIALVRPCWSIVISWIILACTNDYGGPVNWILSLPIFRVLNRFTYGIYLTHVTLLFVMTYGTRRPEYFSDYNLVYQFWGTLWLSSGLAIILVFMAESPIIVLEKILLGGFGQKSNEQQNQDPENDNVNVS